MWFKYSLPILFLSQFFILTPTQATLKLCLDDGEDADWTSACSGTYQPGDSTCTINSPILVTSGCRIDFSGQKLIFGPAADVRPELGDDSLDILSSHIVLQTGALLSGKKGGLSLIATERLEIEDGAVISGGNSSVSIESDGDLVFQELKGSLVTKVTNGAGTLSISSGGKTIFSPHVSLLSTSSELSGCGISIQSEGDITLAGSIRTKEDTGSDATGAIEVISWNGGISSTATLNSSSVVSAGDITLSADKSIDVSGNLTTSSTQREMTSGKVEIQTNGPMDGTKTAIRFAGNIDTVASGASSTSGDVTFSVTRGDISIEPNAKIEVSAPGQDGAPGTISISGPEGKLEYGNISIGTGATLLSHAHETSMNGTIDIGPACAIEQKGKLDASGAGDAGSVSFTYREKINLGSWLETKSYIHVGSTSNREDANMITDLTFKCRGDQSTPGCSAGVTDIKTLLFQNSSQYDISPSPLLFSQEGAYEQMVYFQKSADLHSCPNLPDPSSPGNGTHPTENTRYKSVGCQQASDCRLEIMSDGMMLSSAGIDACRVPRCDRTSSSQAVFDYPSAKWINEVTLTGSCSWSEKPYDAKTLDQVTCNLANIAQFEEEFSFLYATSKVRGAETAQLTASSKKAKRKAAIGARKFKRSLAKVFSKIESLKTQGGFRSKQDGCRLKPLTQLQTYARKPMKMRESASGDFSVSSSKLWEEIEKRKTLGQLYLSEPNYYRLRALSWYLREQNRELMARTNAFKTIVCENPEQLQDPSLYSRPRKNLRAAGTHALRSEKQSSRNGKRPHQVN